MKNIFKATLLVLGLGTTIYSSAQTSMSCEGVKMQAEGDKNAIYTSSADGMTRNIFGAIRQDSVIMTIFRTKADGSTDMLKKWHVYIGDLDFSKPATGVFHFMNGSEKIHKLNFIVVAGRNYFYEEILCNSVKKLNIVNSSNAFEVSFNDEAKARAFFEKVKAIKITLPETKTAGAAKKDDKLDPFMYIYNDTKKEACLKTESSQIQCFNPSSEHTLQVSVGDNVFYYTKDGKKQGVAFKVTEQMMRDHKINLSNQTKK